MTVALYARTAYVRHSALGQMRCVVQLKTLQIEIIEGERTDLLQGGSRPSNAYLLRDLRCQILCALHNHLAISVSADLVAVFVLECAMLLLEREDDI